MLQKLLCFLLGHKTVYNVFTGETAEVSSHLTGDPIIEPIFRVTRSAFCHRCGKLVHKDLEDEDGQQQNKG